MPNQNTGRHAAAQTTTGRIAGWIAQVSRNSLGIWMIAQNGRHS